MVSSPTDQYLVAGKFTAAYGIKGWLKVHVFLDEPSDLTRYSLFCRRAGSQTLQPLKLLAVKPHGKGYVAQLDGCDDRNAAELMVRCELLLERSALPDLEEGDFYWNDLLGLQVISSYEGKEYSLGIVDALLETGSNDVLVVKGSQGSMDKRERLIPYLPNDVVVQVDLTVGNIIVNWDPEF
jgi:16S rRNA processing protein RimM